MKIKNISEESDLTLLKEYTKHTSVNVSIGGVMYLTFMIALFYIGYARWLFWVLISLQGIVVLINSFDKVLPVKAVIRKELIERGYTLW